MHLRRRLFLGFLTCAFAAGCGGVASSVVNNDARAQPDGSSPIEEDRATAAPPKTNTVPAPRSQIIVPPRSPVEADQPDATTGTIWPSDGRSALPPSSASPCPDAPAPEVFARPTHIAGISIALTTTHVYWIDSSSLMRQAKAGGAAEKVADVIPNGSGIFIDSGTMYWQNTSTIFRMPTDASVSPQALVSNAVLGAWAPAGPVLYYLEDTENFGSGRADDATSRLLAIPSDGGPTTLRAEQPHASSLGPFIANATGVYWGYNSRNDPAHDAGTHPSSSGIKKLAMTEGSPEAFAPATRVDRLLTDSVHVAWTDNQYPGPTDIWSSLADGSARTLLGTASLVRGLAIEGDSIYWAASGPQDEYSDIYTTSLAGGTARLLACHVAAVYGLRADEHDVYYFTYTESPIIGRIPKVRRNEL